MLESVAFVFDDRALFLGDRSATELHAHHAIEVSLALDEQGIDLCVPGEVDLVGVPGAVVRGDVGHRFVVRGPKIAMFYLERTGPQGVALERVLGDAPAVPLQRDLAREPMLMAQQLFDPAAPLSAAVALWRLLLDSLGIVPASPVLDPRLRAALAFVDAHLAEPPSLAQVADHVGVSSSRLGHLMKAQVGLPMRRYVLWMRLREALTGALQHGNMTEAAHVAGFADAAHFARTCKQMFGLPASAFAPVDRVVIAPRPDRSRPASPVP